MKDEDKYGGGERSLPTVRTKGLQVRSKKKSHR